jgi:hypothetical protein
MASFYPNRRGKLLGAKQEFSPSNSVSIPNGFCTQCRQCRFWLKIGEIVDSEMEATYSIKACIRKAAGVEFKVTNSTCPEYATRPWWRFWS